MGKRNPKAIVIGVTVLERGRKIVAGRELA